MKKILAVMFFLLLCVAAVGAWFYQELLDFEQAEINVDDEGMIYLVSRGMNIRKIGQELEAKGIIKDARYFLLLSRWKRPQANIKAGEFFIPKGSKPLDMVDIFVAGISVEYKITLVEGWNFKQMMQAVNSQAVLIHQLKDKTDAEIMQYIGQDNIHPEGQFLPDTYSFPRGTSDVELLKRVYRAMQTTLAEEWANKDKGLPIKTAYEALILASIIEKETALASERQDIAGVFIRRLNKGMKLQTDPTVIYGMGVKYQGNIRKKDLREDTPYNTYVHKGLTPTPISMPGRDAIYAALHPAAGTSLFFVATGTGGHTFSTTLKQHNNAVRVYLRTLRAKK